MIFVIMGKSGTGKDTLVSALLDNVGIDLEYMVPYTTRPMREGEVEGKNYHYVTEEEFKKDFDSEKVVEYRTYPHYVDGNVTYYTKDDIPEHSNLPEAKHYIIVSTPDVFKKIKEYYENVRNIPVRGIYLDLDPVKRLERCFNRELETNGTKYQELIRRFLADENDYSTEKLKDYLSKDVYVLNVDSSKEEIKKAADNYMRLAISTYQEETIKPYMKAVFNAFNTFGNCKNIALNQLEGKKDALIAYFALTGIELAYTYEAWNKDPWDDRKKASMKYAYENKEKFYELFTKIAGFALDIKSGEQHFSKAYNYKQLVYTSYYPWINILVNEHPTIVQSYMRGYVGALAEELGLPDSGFPMI